MQNENEKTLIIIDPSPLACVAEFHQTFKHPILPKPAIPSAERVKLRISLLEEELKELKEAIENKDLVEVADAFCDLQYVLSGAILEFGFGEKFYDLFSEVHRSNMSKACKDEAEAVATCEAHFNKTGEDCRAQEDASGNYLVYRITDNKTIKSINYSPADLKPIIDRVESFE